jgi:hypothetical protein
MTAHRDDAACTGAVVRKPPRKETVMGELIRPPRALSYVGLDRLHNFKVMARMLRIGDLRFGTTCDFNELGVAEIAHSTTLARSASR